MSTEKIRAAIYADELIRAGGALANIAFNIAQRPGGTITAHECETIDRCRREWDAARAAMPAAASAEQSAVPTGWKLVPVKPDDAMGIAAGKADDEGFEAGRSHGASWREIYDAMLAAAPQPPQQPSAAPGSEQKVIAWVRRHPDGALSSEFLADYVIEPVRKNSGAWIPLVRGDLPAAPATLSAPKLMELWQKSQDQAVTGLPAPLYFARLLAAAGNSQSQDAVPEEIEEAAEILANLISNIKEHGNYSTEATLTFLGQLKQCLDAAMSKQEGGEGA